MYHQTSVAQTDIRTITNALSHIEMIVQLDMKNMKRVGLDATCGQIDD